MLLVTNKAPIIKGYYKGIIDEAQKFDKPFNIVPAGHVFKVVAVDHMNVFLSSKDIDTVVSVRTYSEFFTVADIDI